MTVARFSLTVAVIAGTAYSQNPASPVSVPAGRTAQSLPVIPTFPTPRTNGSVLSGSATSDVLALSLKDAIDRGLQFNLGVVSSEQNRRQVVASRLQALSVLLPNLASRVSETSQQVNLQAFGF